MAGFFIVLEIPHMLLPKYKNKALTVGCHDVISESRICGTKTELMDMSSLKWSNGPEFNIGKRAPYPNLYVKTTVL